MENMLRCTCVCHGRFNDHFFSQHCRTKTYFKQKATVSLGLSRKKWNSIKCVSDPQAERPAKYRLAGKRLRLGGSVLHRTRVSWQGEYNGKKCICWAVISTDRCWLLCCAPAGNPVRWFRGRPLLQAFSDDNFFSKHITFSCMPASTPLENSMSRF